MTTDKGRVFKATDFERLNKKNPMAAQEYAEKQTERHRVVAHDPVKGPLIREELTGRMLQKLKSPKARRIVGSMLRLTREERREVAERFDANGDLVWPWKVED